MIERDKEYYNQKISELYAVIENQEKIIRDLQEEVKGYQTMYFDKVMMVNKAIDKLYLWGEIIDKGFQREMLEILGGEENGKNI